MTLIERHVKKDDPERFIDKVTAFVDAIVATTAGTR
jgi:hypothetical protein